MIPGTFILPISFGKYSLNMKNFTVKNYKGNIIESLKKFQEKHPETKIIEVIENGNNLKIKCNESIDKSKAETLIKEWFNEWFNEWVEDCFLTIRPNLFGPEFDVFDGRPKHIDDADKKALTNLIIATFKDCIAKYPN